MFFLMLHPIKVFSQVQICEIIYDEKGLDQQNELSSSNLKLNHQSRKRCTQIGNEFNKYGDSLPDKPIFACCHK